MIDAAPARAGSGARRPWAKCFLAGRGWQVAALAIAAIAVVAGKQAYRTASAADLAPLLAPTAHVVTALGCGRFTFDPALGWVDPGLGFAIAPPCAGLHFALAAFVALVLGWRAGMRDARSTAWRVASAAGLAYAATLVVNTIRIAIAIRMHRMDLAERDELHRLEGILVYLGGLCALYALAKAVDRSRPAARIRRLRWLAVPIAAYLAITLVLPALHGAARRADFARHALWVLAGCAAVAAIALLAAGLVAGLVAGRTNLARTGGNKPGAARVRQDGGPP